MSGCIVSCAIAGTSVLTGVLVADGDGDDDGDGVAIIVGVGVSVGIGVKVDDGLAVGEGFIIWVDCMDGFAIVHPTNMRIRINILDN